MQRKINQKINVYETAYSSIITNTGETQNMQVNTAQRGPHLH